MLHLYRHTEDKTFFWQLSDKDEKVSIIQTGELGKVGSCEEILTSRKNEIIEAKEAEGYEEPCDSEWQALTIEYGRIFEEDIPNLDTKMERLRADVEKILGDRGLGTDVSVSGLPWEELEVLCAVIDCHLAKEIIESFKDAPHIGGYERIYTDESFK